jgi:hypothetical protein
MPHRFDGIELGAIRGQQTKMKAMSVTREPLLHFGSLVIRRIVMNQEDFLSAILLR